MHILFFILLSFLLIQNISAQDDLPKPPTKTEMKAQLAQANVQMQELITDLEKQIAEAKANKEDPVTIQELEKQLASMKKMMGSVQKASTLSLERPKKKSDIVDKVEVYTSPIVPIPLKQPIVIPTEAQAKDKLLWYKGKKIDPITIVTTGGMVVRYNQAGNLVIVRPDQRKDTPIINLVSRLAKTGRMKNDFVRTEAGIMNSFFMYPEIEKAYEEFDFIQKRYDKIVKNTIDLPSTNGYPRRRPSDPNSENVGGPFYNPELNDIEIMWGLEDMHQELLNLLNNPPPMDFPDPPKRPNDLCQCDKTIREQYELELSQWSEKFWGYEDKLLQAYKRIHRFITDNSSANPAAIASLGSDLQRALQLAIQRRDDKLSDLMSRYWSDITREEVIVMAAIANEREKQKLGVADINSSVMQRVKGMLFSDHFNLYIDQQALAKNYNLLFDYSLYLSHEFHKQLCEPTLDMFHTRFFSWQEWLKQYNRFNFEMDMDFELHIKGLDNEPVLKANGKLKVDPLYVSIGRLGCKWQLFKGMINHETAMEDDVPLTVKVNYSAIKKIKEAEIWKDYNYAGPNEMQMVFPSVRFSFCKGAGQDTLLLDVFRFSNAKLTGHIEACPGYCDFAKVYCLDILEYANKMIIGIMNARDNAPEFTDLAAEMMDLSAEVHVDPTGSSTLDEIQMEYSANLQRHKKQEKLWNISKIGGAVILFDATNGSPVLIDNNANVTNREVEIKFELVRGIIHTKVEHKPITLTPPRLHQY